MDDEVWCGSTWRKQFAIMVSSLCLPTFGSLRRPLRLVDSSRSVTVTISHPLNLPFLLIQVHHSPISSADEAVILEQVGRMLRISNKDERDVMECQEMHSSARKNGLGLIFRSPSFFGNAVKSILLCNCSFDAKSIKNIEAGRGHQALSLLQPKIALDGNARLKRKRSKCSDDIGNFPSWKELLAWSLFLTSPVCLRVGNFGQAHAILQASPEVMPGHLYDFISAYLTTKVKANAPMLWSDSKDL
ncbi:hypothetical protein PVK06_025478 [Gossypium arboreum]|uniref:Uncharacterized protein n=1 Tax=Gossypium arboreum TaxID=29729 RepID=A0ABR0PGM5_GOSAR|nr:hypothetical protein PVK06_025478 [Gossypium arboreum]